MIGDAVLEHVAPAVGEGPKDRRDMGAYRLAFRPGRAFAGATLELFQHGRIGDGRRVDVADAWLVHRFFSSEVLDNGASRGTTAAGRLWCRIGGKRSTALDI